MMASSLLWLTPLLSFAVGLGMLLVRDRRVLATLDVAGSLAVLGLTLAITNRVVQAGPVGALGIFRADHVAVLFLVLIGTVLIPYQITLIPQYIVYHTLGWDASFLPLTVPNFFGNAFYIFLLRQYFMTLPRELDEAAMVDGAGHFKILTNIIVPQAWTAIAAVALFQFLFSWNDFIGPLLYLTGWTDLTPVSLGLTYFGIAGPMVEAGAIVSLAVPVALAFMAQRAFMRGIVISGVET